MKNLFYFFIFLLANVVYSQSLSVFDIDTSNFPIMKAKFFAFDKTGKQIRPKINDFSITENGQPRTLLNVTCPSPQPQVPLSSVLVFDVSKSMLGNGLEIEKDVAVTWINMLQLGLNECSITSFSDNNYINQDLTTNQNKLVNAIDALKIFDGTDYNAALIDPAAGGILIAKTGKHKKIIIFLSDGQPQIEPRTQDIINEALNNKITIYCLSINSPAHSTMIEVAKQTGGLFFENIRNKEEAEIEMRKIFANAQNFDPCQIEWLSGFNCIFGKVDVELKYYILNMLSEGSYTTPNKSIAKLEFKPNILSFKKAKPGVVKDTTITVTAQNSDFNILNINVSNQSFKITPTSFKLKAGESKILNINFLPPDSGYNYCKFSFVSDLCTSKFYATGGFPGKKAAVRTLKLIQPNGGEVFFAGNDTLISWDGVPPEEPVTIEYRTDDSKPWVKLTDSAKGLSYKFNVPKIASNKYLARVTAKVGNYNYINEMVLIPSGTFQRGNTGNYSGTKDEKPVNNVELTRSFFLSKYEVTQMEYEAVTGNNPSDFVGENLPVETVTWYEAIEFCNKLSEIEGLDLCYSIAGHAVSCDWNANGYRLPTEAEWEYACKAGSFTDFYNGILENEECNPLDINLDRISWFCGNSNGKTHEVGLKESNKFGIYDMSGNVAEWCWDWKGLYPDETVIDPNGPLYGEERIARGGSWIHHAKNCRSSIRNSYKPDFKFNLVGFRICRTY